MASADVEMKDVEDVQPQTETPKTKSPLELANLFQADLLQALNMLIRGVSKRDDRLVARGVRQTLAQRRKVLEMPEVLRNVLDMALAHQDYMFVKATLARYLSTRQQSMDTSAEDESAQVASTPVTPLFRTTGNKVPEMVALLQLLVVMYLIDVKAYDEACECASSLINLIQQNSRHSMDIISARAYFYYSRAHELAGRLQDIRGSLLAALRTAALRHDANGQLMALNLLLRNYLEYNLYDQAVKLVAKTTLPETRDNNQLARYFFYLGKIKAIQLEYSQAYECLNQALRKAPTATGLGFKLALHKVLCIVQLLMGEIPERRTFMQPAYKKDLKPYHQLVKAVRVGDLAAFRGVVDKYGESFKADRTFTLIQRVRQNVIKTGLRKISLSYSRISLNEICEKLHLDNPEDCEFIVAKAIKDGVIDATIDHAQGFIKSKETADVYSTTEPADAFRKRIRFCLDIHNDAVKAMRFPPNSHKEELETEEEREKRLQEEKEIVAAVEEGDDEEDEDEGMDF